jgi:hypothetical protein
VQNRDRCYLMNNDKMVISNCQQIQQQSSFKIVTRSCNHSNFPDMRFCFMLQVYSKYQDTQPLILFTKCRWSCREKMNRVIENGVRKSPELFILLLWKFCFQLFMVSLDHLEHVYCMLLTLGMKTLGNLSFTSQNELW